jgi:putative DNA primase/helicase
VQPFLLGLRRRTAVLVVHHTNKHGSLRGSAQHEDVLDLRRPTDYKPQQGARFELHIEKARALSGHEIEPIEVQLRIDAAGRADWTWWPIELQDSHRVAALLRDGRNPSQIARKLGISKSKAYRLSEQTPLRP